MKRRTGDMWVEYTSDPGTLFLFCANARLKEPGELVMGAGSAKVARDMFPGLAMELGDALYHKQGTMYGVALSTTYNVGAFQTKDHWRDPSGEHIIRFSVAMLLSHVHRYDTIHLPYPGIGHGGLDMATVEPIISVLPDNVVVWTYS